MTKKAYTIFAVVCLLIITAMFTAPALAANPISVLVNSRPLDMDVPPIIEEGRTLAPVRAIAESLGAYVNWKAEERRVEVELDGRKLVLFIDNTTAYVDGIPKQLDVPARIVEGRTLIPARFIGESLHAEVGWDAVTRTVIIITYENAAPYSAALAQMEAEILREINARRAKLSRAPLLAVDELTQMARGHAAELAQKSAFSHDSVRFGDTSARAAARGLKVNFEYLTFGLPDAAAIAEALISADQGGRLLAEEGRFFGLGLYKAQADGNADIFAVAELTEGEGFMLGSRQRRLDTPQLALSGYAVEGAPLTIYQLNERGEYLSRQSYKLSVDGAGRYTFNTDLWQHGRFAASVGKDSVIFLYE
ncbi:MAG: stalk domain-containing protein [Clostridiales bacterium]|nr:stalk domain-containing protein [Clostridiales bacterium]